MCQLLCSYSTSVVLGESTPTWPLRFFFCVCQSHTGSHSLVLSKVTWHICSDLLLYGDLVIYFPYFQAIKINCTIASMYFPVKAICFLMKQYPYYLPRKFFLSASKQCCFYSVSCICETTLIQLSTQARNLGVVLDPSLLLAPISSPQVSYLCLLSIS